MAKAADTHSRPSVTRPLAMSIDRRGCILPWYHACMAKYDFYVAGRWRNKDMVEHVVKSVRGVGYSVFSFLENDYSDVLQQLGLGSDAMKSENTEKLPLSHPLIRAIFEKDMQGIKDSGSLLLVLLAGIAGHIELGVAYGMGKKCYAIGQPEKTETLCGVLDGIFPDERALLESRFKAIKGNHVGEGVWTSRCLGDVRFQHLANVRKYGKHYVHIGMLAGWVSGEPEVLEPEKSETWDWYALGALPEPMFEMCKLSLDSYQTGRTLYED